MDITEPIMPTNRPAAPKVTTIGRNTSWKGTSLNSYRLWISVIFPVSRS